MDSTHPGAKSLPSTPFGLSGSPHQHQPQQQFDEKSLQKLQIQDPVFQIPKVSERGKAGRQIPVEVNHFPVRINLPHVFTYHVKFECPFWKFGPKRADAPVMIAAFEMVKKKRPDIFPKRFASIFDGNDMVIASVALKLKNGAFQETVIVPKFSDVPEESKFPLEITMKLSPKDKIDMKSMIERFCKSGDTNSRPLEQILIMNHIFSYKSKLSKLTLGRNVYFPNFISKIGMDGKFLWEGIFSSFRPASKPFLNIDLAYKPAYEELDTLQFLACCVLKLRGEVDELVRVKPDHKSFLRMAVAVAKLKIRYHRPDKQIREFRVNDQFGPSANEKNTVQGKMSVAQYFQKEYNYKVLFPHLPTLHVGPATKQMFIPLELTKIKKQACPMAKKLNDKETSDIIKRAAIPPTQRKKQILENAKSLQDNFHTENEFAKEFKIQVSSEMEKLSARVLTHPNLQYSITGKPADKANVQVEVNEGKWNMIDKKRSNVKFNDGKKLNFWGVLVCGDVTKKEFDVFLNNMEKEGSKMGFEVVNKHPSFKINILQNPDDLRKIAEIESIFESLAKDLIKSASPMKETPLIMVISPDQEGPLYARLKYLGDVQMRIVTQFVKKKNVQQAKPTTIHNLLLKMNSKLEGINQMLAKDSRPDFMAKPFILFGADVTHPSPDTPLDKKVSIAAVVASGNAKCNSFNVQIRLQKSDVPQVVEKILDFQEMAKNLLDAFIAANRGIKPGVILYYRDGVSEGQFLDILCHELSAIHRACAQIDANYKPKVTFLVAQKRHKTRIFAANPTKDGVGRMKNIPPGTILDHSITNPTEESFFLASHEGIQGTTRPTGYHKLYDDMNFHPDEIQKITFYLTHLYARCERSVSLPAPTYYAHLAAFRARHHLESVWAKFGNSEKNRKAKEEELNSAIQRINYFM